ncbi:MAG: PQQ-binding-like beta-propeller repeat protein [Pseudomonadota bacterium]
MAFAFTSRLSVSRRHLRAGICAVLALALSGCAGSGLSLGNLLGGDDQKPLAGQRESVIVQSGVLAPDPELLTQANNVPPPRRNPDWPQAGGNASHALGNLAVSSQPRQVWSVDAGAGSGDGGRLTAQPVVAAGRVYVIDVASRVSAFSTSGGQQVWSVDLKPKDEDSDGGVGGGIAFEAGRLIVTTTFGEVVSLDAARGAVVWRKRLDVPVRAAPTVSNGRIYFAAVNNEVHSLSAFDGGSAWKYQGIGEKASRTASTSAAISGNTVVVPLTTGEILAFDASTGLSNWGDALSGSTRFSGASVLTDITGRPVIDNGKVYAIAGAGSIGGFDLSSGEALWDLPVSGTETPWVAGDYLYTIVNGNILTAISKHKGKARWSYRLSEGGTWAGPVMGNGNLIAASSSGKLVFVSYQTGRPVNNIDLGDPIFISPVIANGTIYVFTDTGRLVALR